MAANKPEVIVEGDVVYITRPGLAVYVKTADICRLIGKSNQWVGQLVSQGTLHKKKTPHGLMFELASNMPDYCARLEARAEPEKSDAELKRENAKSAAEITLKAAKATIAQLEAAELQGKMHRSEDVAAMTEEKLPPAPVISSTTPALFRASPADFSKFSRPMNRMLTR